LLGDQAAVCWKPIPDQQDVAGDVAEQVFEKLNDLFGLDGAFEDLKVEVPEEPNIPTSNVGTLNDDLALYLMAFRWADGPPTTGAQTARGSVTA
jgi:hypothetical protein